MDSSAKHRRADSSNKGTASSANPKGDDSNLTEELEEKILPLLEWIQDEHGELEATGERACPFCGSRLRYQIANKGKFICCQCETPDCFFLIT